MKLTFQNYWKLLKNKIEFWKSLPLSLIGRVNAIKMVCLPQLLYLFQNVPVYLTISFFKKLDSLFLPFIWNFKSNRIKKKHLCKTNNQGGLALPEFKYYYLHHMFPVECTSRAFWLPLLSGVVVCCWITAGLADTLDYCWTLLL